MGLVSLNFKVRNLFAYIDLGEAPNSKKCSALFYEMQVKILFREFDLFDHVNFTAY